MLILIILGCLSIVVALPNIFARTFWRYTKRLYRTGRWQYDRPELFDQMGPSTARFAVSYVMGTLSMIIGVVFLISGVRAYVHSHTIDFGPDTAGRAAVQLDATIRRQALSVSASPRSQGLAQNAVYQVGSSAGYCPAPDDSVNIAGVGSISECQILLDTTREIELSGDYSRTGRITLQPPTGSGQTVCLTIAADAHTKGDIALSACKG